MKVFITGTGNVATTFGKALSAAGHNITGVFGRNSKNVKTLSDKLQCKGFLNISEIPLNSDVYLVAIKDDALESVIVSIPEVKGVVAHTSGASALGILKRFPHHGVFYPVETIVRSHSVNLKMVPLCIEASDDFSTRKLMQLARTLSSEIYLLNSHQRNLLHVAAVFTNNFTNALLEMSTSMLNKEQLPPDLLKQLAISTVQNAFRYGAHDSQTGPARRNDRKTIQKHLELLSGHPELVQIYKLFTRYIRNVHNKS